MSHTPDQPHEVPFREVAHEDPDDSMLEGMDYIGGVGAVKDWDWWGSADDDRRLRAELATKEQARARLGGFGFH